MSAQGHELPLTWERQVQGATEATVSAAMGELLAARGFKRSDSPDAGATWVRDTVLDAAYRRTGKVRLAGAGVLIMVVLIAIALGAGDSRELLSPILLGAVVLGGMGLNRLKDPAKIHRRIVRVEVQAATGESDEVQLRVHEGVARAEGELTLEWLDDTVAEIDESTYEELIERIAVPEPGEKRP